MRRQTERIDSPGDRHQPLVEIARQRHAAAGVEGRLHESLPLLQGTPRPGISKMPPQIGKHRLADPVRGLGREHLVDDPPPPFDFPGPARGVGGDGGRVDRLLTLPRRGKSPPQVLGRTLDPLPSGGALVGHRDRRPRLDERADDIEHDDPHPRRGKRHCQGRRLEDDVGHGAVGRRKPKLRRAGPRSGRAGFPATSREQTGRPARGRDRTPKTSA